MLSGEDAILSKDFRPETKMPRDFNDDRPPVFNTWGQLYAAITGYLFLLIGLFYAFTRAYRISP